MNINAGKIPIRRALVALAAVGGIALIDADAAANDLANEPLTAVVSYADLNLNKQAGAETMHRRLQVAARKVCAPLEGRHRARAPWRECVDRAVARAVEQLDKPALTAHHLAKQRKTDARVARAKG